MKKKVLTTIAILAIMTTMITTSYAASYDGKIWTGKPTVFNIGYYCTAAQNKSGGNESTHFQWAKTYLANGQVINAREEGKNTRVVASSKNVHPLRGKGGYGEKGWETTGSFSSGAWD